MGQLLGRMGYILQAPPKQNEGAQHPDRDAQFRHVDVQAQAHLEAGEPVISVDDKRKKSWGTWPTTAASGSRPRRQYGSTCTTSPPSGRQGHRLRVFGVAANEGVRELRLSPPHEESCGALGLCTPSAPAPEWVCFCSWMKL